MFYGSIFLCIFLSCTKEHTENDGRGTENIEDYVDLGLPSGTLWKTVNETNPNDENDFYTYEEAINKYGDKLPTKEQLLELKNYCEWAWDETKKGYVVTGRNGNAIFLSARGWCSCNQLVSHVGCYSYYWSSTSNDSSNAYYLCTGSGGLSMINGRRCLGLSVRLVYVFPPQVITTEIFDITSNSATSGGNVISYGGSNVTARGVCWSTSVNPTIDDSHTIDGSGVGVYSSYLTGLISSTTYYVRAYATNSAGTAYGNQISFTTSEGECFSVSADSRVLFSHGNLQWSATGGGSTPSTHIIASGGIAAGTWRFAPNQWDVIGVANINISDSYSGWIDLFGWATSGYNNKYPYLTSATYSDYGNNDASISNTNYDWGVYNSIYDPYTGITYSAGTWRTLTNSEWHYVLNTRNTPSGIRYAKAKVNGVPGLIIVPDNWNSSIYSFNNPNSASADYLSNVITADQWTVIEGAKCVFIPAAGYRNCNCEFFDVGISGSYWTSTQDGFASAFELDFNSNNVDLLIIRRCCGQSVRLVRSAN